jgi:hypothetical protein
MKVESDRRDGNRKSFGAKENAWGSLDHAATLAAPHQASVESDVHQRRRGVRL